MYFSFSVEIEVNMEYRQFYMAMSQIYYDLLFFFHIEWINMISKKTWGFFFSSSISRWVFPLTTPCIPVLGWMGVTLWPEFSLYIILYLKNFLYNFTPNFWEDVISFIEQ